MFLSHELNLLIVAIASSQSMIVDEELESKKRKNSSGGDQRFELIESDRRSTAPDIPG